MLQLSVLLMLPVSAVVRPSGQEMHGVGPALSLYEPIEHSVHASATSSSPIGQVTIKVRLVTRKVGNITGEIGVSLKK